MENQETERMIKRTIPKTGEEIPVMGLGSWQTFDIHHADAARRDLRLVLKEFSASGGRLIDSSPMYGSSEKVIGDLTSELQLRDHLFVATKVWTTGKEAGIDQMNASFRNMKVDVMDLIQVHNLQDVQTHLQTLADWKQRGKIRYTGITHYTVAAYTRLTELIKTNPIDFVQFNYNLLVREAEKDLLPLAMEKGVGVIINRPFEEGKLFNLVKGKKIPGWAAEYEIQSWGQFFLTYIISHPAVTCVIPATSNAAHLRDNMKAAYGRSPDEKFRKKMVDFIQQL